MSHIRPWGTSFQERAYGAAREMAAAIAKRVKEHPRCRRCFAHGFRPDRDWGLRYACEGCAELESGIAELRRIFAEDTAVNTAAVTREG